MSASAKTNAGKRQSYRGPVQRSQYTGPYEYSMLITVRVFFFFQAEDGIRDVAVTGVQTCALPISAITRELKTADLLERLRVAGVPSAPILTVDAVLAEPQTRASGMLVGAPHPRIPDYQSVGLPILWNDHRPEVRRVPPRLG